ncbi:MAG: hypothetical protein IJ065_13710 [Eubacterium sp.]|nr:hypothetical protein [Eubacterium sp.]
MNFDTCDENVILGYAGALLGGLIGISLWIFCGYFGIIPGIVGFIFAYLTIKGYMLLAGSISRQGLIGCIIICILLIILAEFGVVMLTIFIDRNIRNLPEIIKSVPGFIRSEKLILKMVRNILVGIFTFGVGCFGMFFRLWNDTRQGPTENAKIDNGLDIRGPYKMPERKEIPIKGNMKWVILMVIAAIVFVIGMTIWRINI